jgi:prepilin-type processing-associated H-X9-DG protein
MTIGRVLTACAILAAIALGTSSPAWAKDMSGSYTAQEAGDPPAVWTFTPCGNGCANIVFADGRTGQATIDRGQWRLDDVGNDSAIKCTADGTQNPGTAHYSWDPITLAGQVWATDDTGACGALPGTDTVEVPFNLTRAS